LLKHWHVNFLSALQQPSEADIVFSVSMYVSVHMKTAKQLIRNWTWYEWHYV